LSPFQQLGELEEIAEEMFWLLFDSAAVVTGDTPDR
jgi:hypothetical protein